MSNLKSSIIESIKVLPPLSSTITEINRICADKNSTIADMAKVIENDPMIVANILKIANSPLYGFGREIKNVIINKPFFEISINFGLKIASDAGYDTTILEESISQIMSFKE